MGKTLETLLSEIDDEQLNLLLEATEWLPIDDYGRIVITSLTEKEKASLFHVLSFRAGRGKRHCGRYYDTEKKKNGYRKR